MNRKGLIFYFLYFQCLIILFILPYKGLTQSFIVIDSNENESGIDIGNQISILEDKTSNLSLNQVIASTEFIPSKSNVPNLGISSSSFWIKFFIKNKSGSDNLLVMLQNPILDEVEMYAVSENIAVTKMGENKPFRDRLFKYPNYIFEIKVPQNEVRQFFLKVRGSEQIMLPLKIGSPYDILSEETDHEMILGLYSGIILVMFLYNLFLFFSVRDRRYLYYVIYIILIGLTQTTLHGFTFKYLWPNSVWFAAQSVNIFSCLVGISAIEFIKVFLNTKENTPKLHKVFYMFNIVFGVSLILSLINYKLLSFQLMQANTMVASIYSLIVVIVINKSGYRPAKFFLMAWSVLLLGAFVFVLKDYNIISYNSFVNYILQIASVIEIILLSFALGDSINILKKEKDESQREALEALQENDRLLKAQNVILDQKVKERTQELQHSNVNLERALVDLKDAQGQLVNAEKMASLGQLTAGIAHEINNPINFVTSSIKPLKRDVHDLISVLDSYKGLNLSNFDSKVKEINELIKDLDIDYVKEEIESLLKGIEDGASRTSQIVMGLKTFSRIDETDLKKVDLNEGLDSTLVILNSELRDRVFVEKEYGNIPKVECYAGKINQVFMNILNNAVFAVNKKNTKESGKIIIKTKEENNQVIISIRDNGIGIPDNVKHKIFDPFFTTKDVGEGTGLGLSIVYNIIETHKGLIKVDSKEGEGTEFTITLPTEHPSV